MTTQCARHAPGRATPPALLALFIPDESAQKYGASPHPAEQEQGTASPGAVRAGREQSAGLQDKSITKRVKQCTLRQPVVL